MTIARMKEYLENRGFKTETTYNPRSTSYEFRIIKDGIEVVDNFKCTPSTVDCEELDRRQRAFISNLVDKWEFSEYEEYVRKDVEMTHHMYGQMLNSKYGANGQYIPQIKNVIFNPPATIVFWADGTKTVVKCQDGDMYDNEVGLAMAIAKKALGNKGNYCNVFKKWLPECDDSVSIEFDSNELLARMGKAVAAFDRVLNRRRQNDHS